MFDVTLETMAIQMTAGDTGTVTYEITGDTLTTTDKVLWAMMNSRGEIMLAKFMETSDNSTFTISFSNTDTCNLNAGTYRYDIRVIVNPSITGEADPVNVVLSSADDVVTVMNATLFTVIGPVGRISTAE